LPPRASACRSPSAARPIFTCGRTRAHTLCYSEGDPKQQTVGFEVEDDASLQDAASTLGSLGHPVHAGTAQEAEQRKVRAFIGFRDPTGKPYRAGGTAGAQRTALYREPRCRHYRLQP
jgi:hypothetical protein